MFEYHGWIAIKFKPISDEVKSKKSQNQISAINSLIEKHKNKIAKFDIFYQLGEPFIRLDGCLPHYQGWVLKLFFAINEIASNSEGVLFIKDEENPFLDSEYHIWQMMDGKVLSGDMTFFPDICEPHHSGLHVA